MTGNFVDSIRYYFKSLPAQHGDNIFYLDTDFGKIRVFDTKGVKPVIINAPDGPNVIEHQMPLIMELSKYYRVVYFEFPGVGMSFPNFKFDYTIKSGSELLIQVMDLLEITEATLLFSCSNGFYAMKAASEFPDRFRRIFLSQTPSTKAMLKWAEKSIPATLKIPVIGQIVNAVKVKEIAGIWYKYALPKKHPQFDNYTQMAKQSLINGGCFCLSSLVQGLKRDANSALTVSKVPTTLVWGAMDFTHRKTDKEAIKNHINNCEIIEFKNCGHFPELESTKEFVQLVKERME